VNIKEFNRMIKQLFSIVVLLIGLFLTGAALAQVSAFVDRTEVSDVDTIRLVLTAKQRTAEPDLSPLYKDFDVLSKSTSSRVNLSNGTIDSTYEWIITLAPKRSGKLLIPAISFDKENTNSIEIVVSKDQRDPAKANAQEIYIEAQVVSNNPYVQSQLVYSIKLYHAVELQEGGLSLPKIEKALIERLGDDTSFISTINGRRYRVTERKYAIFPQQSGELIIPSVIFDGHVLDNSRPQTSFDPFFGRRFQSTRQVRVRSNVIKLDILPKPDKAKGKWWLPSKNISLIEQWSPQPPTFRVGETITRTIILRAEGLTDSQLPDITFTEQMGFKFYPDKAEKETAANNNVIISRKIQKVALIPTQAGQIEIPEIVIHWWNTTTNKAMLASIAARKVTVLPALSNEKSNEKSNERPNEKTNGKSNQHSAIQSDISNNNSNKNSFSSSLDAQPDSNKGNNSINQLNAQMFPARFGGWLTLLFLMLWIITLLLWYLYSRRITINKPTDDMEERNSISDQKRNRAIAEAKTLIKSASLLNDPKTTRKQVILWANLVWPGINISNMAPVIKRIEQGDVRSSLIDLDRVLYSSNNSHADWDGGAFWYEFSNVIDDQHGKKQKNQPLKALYCAT